MDGAESFLERTREKFDFIFLDPPYNRGYGMKLLPLLGQALAPGGLVLFEHSRDEVLPEENWWAETGKRVPLRQNPDYDLYTILIRSRTIDGLPERGRFIE